jgi:hypothetical protein
MESKAVRCTLATIAIAIAALGTAAAQRGGRGMPAAPVDPHDLSGYWSLSFDSRKVPPANLAPGVTKAMIDAHAKADAHAIRWCNLLGVPFSMDPGVPLDIRIGTREMIIDASTNSEPRHVYFRDKHVSSDIFDPSTIGDSIGHWEGDTLVVDTVGFSGKRGLTTIPGGGFRTDNSHLVERYQLLENGAVLSVTFTWTDSKVFRTPHTYEFRYYRLPKLYEPLGTLPCNPYDDVRTKFLEDTRAGTPAVKTQ